ncbi:spore maturation protein cgeB [Paenibacillus sambharensis]|uniref:Spore maturation protein cgeB n=1 Tax=Paenibacillus sambharensis TaxID=1803190 RepID=A0A2W1LAH6_9BACL|nr:glycosyltransferase [Paenibacillus sambharensis]PZD95140.1 spore maturation protein cgeB [Paenibacillus sambharensis]
MQRKRRLQRTVRTAGANTAGSVRSRSAARGRASRQTAADREYERGRQDGYPSGYRDGYWLGQCEHVIRHAEQPFPVRPLHVLYVTTGKGYPYSPLDEAVSVSLRQLVGEVTIMAPGENVAQTALSLRPDLVLFLDALDFDTTQVDQIRSEGIRTAVWFTDDPYYTDKTSLLAAHYDDVFTLESTCVDYYRSLGCERVYHLPLAAFPAHFRPRNTAADNRREVCFVGSAYWNRVAFFDQVAEELAQRDVRITGIWWDRLQTYPILSSKIELGRWMEPLQTSETYSGAKIVINMHRSPDDSTFNFNSAGIGAATPNPRTFEIAGCGTLQLTDERSDLARYYTPGVEVATYGTPQELIAKIDYYLAHEEERQTVAMRGLYRTMKEHTYLHRLHSMLLTLFG